MNQYVERERLIEYFGYLDDLRDSGSVNMWGSSVYLQKAYGLQDRIARKVMAGWVSTFKSGVSVEDRVSEFMRNTRRKK